MNKRWNTKILIDENDEDFVFDKPEVYTYRGNHNIYEAMIALIATLGLLIFVGVFLVGLTTIVQYFTN